MSKYLGDWTYERIHTECSGAYNAYCSGLDAHYKAYFTTNPAFAGDHPQKALTLELALPPGMEELAALIPAGQLHLHHLSGKSSQLIGLGLLGAAAKQDPSLLWLEALLSPIPPFSISPPQVRFEYELDNTVLNEQPRVSAIDFLVETDDVVICAEVKFAEEGMGRCSCGVGAIATGTCSQKVLDRPLYWETAKDVFYLPDIVPGKPCPISAGYQAIRNVAASRALANGRTPVFVLLYDERQPVLPSDEQLGWLAGGAPGHPEERQRQQPDPVPRDSLADTRTSDAATWAGSDMGSGEAPPAVRASVVPLLALLDDLTGTRPPRTGESADVGENR